MSTGHKNRTMKALWFEGGEASLRDIPLPIRRPGEALLELRMAGLCNTDLELLRGYMAFTGVPGHELVARVLSSEREDLIGRRVVGDINIPCGACSLCQEGLGRHCPTRRVLGISGQPGCLAEQFTLPEENLHVLPDALSDEDAVLVEPLAAALRIPEQVALPGRILVVGDGKLGLLTALGLRRAGAVGTGPGSAGASDGPRVFLAGHHRDHMELLRPLGIEGDPGGSFPLVVDCTGNPQALAGLLERVRPQGTFVLKSTYAESPSLNVSRLVVDEITLLGSRCGPFEKAIALLLSPGVTEVLSGVREAIYPFDDALGALHHAGQRGALKVLLDNR